MLIVEGSCTDMRDASGAGNPQQDECLIRGEALTPIEIKDPENNTAPVYYGLEQATARRPDVGELDRVRGRRSAATRT